MGNKYRVAVIVLIGLSVVLPITLFTQLMLNSEDLDRRFQRFHPRMLQPKRVVAVEITTEAPPTESQTPWEEYAQDDDVDHDEVEIRQPKRNKKVWNLTSRKLEFLLIKETTMAPIVLPDIVFETIKPRPFLYSAADGLPCRFGVVSVALVVLLHLVG